MLWALQYIKRIVNIHGQQYTAPIETQPLQKRLQKR